MLDIEVVPQNESRYTKAEYNELALNLYQAGIFNPQMTDQALLALSIMDFKGKDDLMQKIQMNGTLMQRLQQAEQIIAGLMGQVAPETGQPMPAGGGAVELREGQEPTVTAKAREQSRAAAQTR